MADTAAASRAPVSAGADELAELIEPVAVCAGCAVHDVQWRGGTLVVQATAAGGGAVGVDSLSALSRGLSAALDAADVIRGAYVLEVSSPGLERRLRRPEHFAGAVGERVVIRTSASPRRRIAGEILRADQAGVTVRVGEMSGAPGTTAADAGESISVPYYDIAKARTVFEWGPAKRNGPSSGAARKQTQQPASNGRPGAASTQSAPSPVAGRTSPVGVCEAGTPTSTESESR